ncbi:MAG TPA: hypothetical protein VMB02_09605 [Candidatus Aquilonibacter sp.]|nr:hypothetical protein [Candidatus Aquilonibacter sp.]
MEIRQPYPPGSPHDRGPGYERRDANVGGLLQFAFWMAVLLAVTLVGMKFTFDHFKKVQPLGATASPMVGENEEALPPRPRLQVQPHLELEDFCAAQQQAVDSYSWIDRQSGVVHIPVDRAMDLILQRGLPTRPASEAPGGALPVVATPPPTAGGVDLLGPCGYLSEHPTPPAPMGKNE